MFAPFFSGVFSGLLSAIWVSLLLAEFSLFNPYAAWFAALAGGCVIYRHEKSKTTRIDNEKIKWKSCFPLIAPVILFLCLSFPPSEWIIGGLDPGVYIHTAASISRCGSLKIEHPDLIQTSKDAAHIFGREYKKNWEPFLGMRMTKEGWLSPQFYHAYPAFMAMFWPIGGVRAALLVNILIGALSIAAVYLLSSRLLGRKWAFAAATILAVNPAQIWQAGFPTSEMLVQMLFLSGTFFLLRGIEKEDCSSSALGGAGLGMALITRYDAVMFVVPFVLALLAVLGQKRLRICIICAIAPIFILGFHSWLHALFLAPFYRPMIDRLIFWLIISAFIAVFIVAGSFVCYRLKLNLSQGLIDRAALITRCLALLAFCMWLIFSWYVRPRLALDGKISDLMLAFLPAAKQMAWFNELAGRNSANIFYFISLFGGIGFITASFGIACLLMKTKGIVPIAWLAASLSVTIILMHRIYHEPFMMFASRRLIPVVIPFFAISIAALCLQIEQVFKTKYASSAAWIVLAACLLPILPSSAIMAKNKDWPGLIDWFDNLSAAFPPNARILCDQPGFAAPLRFIYGFKAYEIKKRKTASDSSPDNQSSTQKDNLFANALQRLKVSDPIYLLTAKDSEELGLAGAIKIGSYPLESCVQTSARHLIPLTTKPRRALFNLYLVTCTQ